MLAKFDNVHTYKTDVDPDFYSESCYLSSGRVQDLSKPQSWKAALVHH